MMRDFKTSQLLELRKLSKQIYDMCDFAAKVRARLIEQKGTCEFEYDKRNSLADPESYYHFKLFDKGVSIIRLYSKAGWFRIDEENKNFHFAIRCYNFQPSLKLESTYHGSYTDYGDFEKIDECMKYFITAIVQITDTEFNIIDPLFKEEYVLEV